MVAFAGRRYAARSSLAFVANSTYTVTSFTLVRRQWNLFQYSFWFSILFLESIALVENILKFGIAGP